MSHQSMTGFARQEGHHDQAGWVWELRSVNGKGLDIRMRLPHGFESIEAAGRTIISKSFKRGNIQVNLQVTQAGGNPVPTINRLALEAVITAAQMLRERIGGNLPSAGDLLALRGVLETTEQQLDLAEQKTRDAALLDGLNAAVDALVVMRQSEGTAIKELLLRQVENIADLHAAIETNDARQPAMIRNRLEAQIAKILEGSDQLDPQRLHQEAVILAAKADLQEELDRVSVHVKAANELLQGKGPAGRKLDFLAQEFNRECNTICSKSNAAEITSLGLDMKLVIDQFREQLQNLE